jgi:hypothetical protein
MRTTIDIPDEIYRFIRRLAVEKNSTVRQIVLDALEAAVLRPAPGPPVERLKLPLIRSTRKDKLVIDNEKIYEIIDFP